MWECAARHCDSWIVLGVLNLLNVDDTAQIECSLRTQQYWLLFCDLDILFYKTILLLMWPWLAKFVSASVLPTEFPVIPYMRSRIWTFNEWRIFKKALRLHLDWKIRFEEIIWGTNFKWLHMTWIWNPPECLRKRKLKRRGQDLSPFSNDSIQTVQGICYYEFEIICSNPPTQMQLEGI